MALREGGTHKENQKSEGASSRQGAAARHAAKMQQDAADQHAVSCKPASQPTGLHRRRGRDNFYFSQARSFFMKKTRDVILRHHGSSRFASSAEVSDRKERWTIEEKEAGVRDHYWSRRASLGHSSCLFGSPSSCGRHSLGSLLVWLLRLFLTTAELL